MKKILSIIALMAFTSCIYAQSSQKSNVTDFEEINKKEQEILRKEQRLDSDMELTDDERATASKKSNLQTTLRDRFKKSEMNLTNTRYTSFLKKMIANKEASLSDRKHAAYFLYGDKYVDHIDEIMDPNTTQDKR